jgi:antitoxin (DNA-binding transcriptional repressor) of toxin-antitoxin stability system
MELRISATELARRVGDILGRIRYRGDSFVIERNGEPIAKLVPLPGHGTATVLEGLQAWREAAPRDPELGDDLARVNEADRPPANPWA